MPLTTRVTVDGGVALEASVWDGSGPAFLLVHGLASCRALWAAVAGHLADRGHAVTTLDLRGHGASDAPATGYDMATVAADVVRVIHGLGIEAPVVAGQSWGANVAIEVAWSTPGAVGGVACIDGGWIDLRSRFPEWERCATALAPPITDGMLASALEARLRAAHPDWPDTGIAAVLACFDHRADGTVSPRLPLERHLDVLHGLWEHRPGDRYPEMRVPVLLVPAGRPGNDGGPAPAVAAAEAALPRSRTEWVLGDHDLHAQRPALVANLLAGAVDDGFFPGRR
ncbi:MAG TPA: alpha/beta hydrolase [Acidimicrobiales bacterium]|nr:alpha/beta hydrolase [Acidimicrobiales bacterium]